MASGLAWGLPAAAIALAIALTLAILVDVILRARRKNRSRNPVAASTIKPVPMITPSAATPVESNPAQVIEGAEIFAKLYGLALGTTAASPVTAADHEPIVAATVVALEDAATQQRYAPRRPNMLPRLMSAANDENVSRRELASIIARDPALVGNLLKIANSSFYRVTPDPVESVDRALALLGTDGLRSLISAALMQPIFRIAGANFPRFPEIAWEHTFRSASAAVPYMVIVERADPFAAELLSLLMGLAGIVIFRVVLDQYALYPHLYPDAAVIASILDKQSASVARRIGASWELSEPTLCALDGQTAAASKLPAALGRSLHFGRLAGAIAVLRINAVIDEETARASIPTSTMPPAQIERMWSRLTARAKD
jgi:HD-like signal output (HDOD) protein